MKRLNIIVSVYACRPHMGSEPGVGWNMVQEIAKHHEVWVLTRADNRPYIESELSASKKSIAGLHFIYCDLLAVAIWKRGLPFVHLHYYLWQIRAYQIAKKLHRDVNFDLAHHITYVRHSSPSFLALLPIPFVWGPVGGGESAPKAFWRDFGWRGKLYETLRESMRSLGERDPFVAMTARRSAIANATTADTANRLKRLGARCVQLVSQVGISDREMTALAQYKAQPKSTSMTPFRFVSIGRLLHWKGFHLGLRAFAEADLSDKAEYWIIGEGAEKRRLQQLAEDLEIADRVTFVGSLSRIEVLQKLGECSALVHPSLHESGGFVCLEAMATGRPVLCLDLGGPAMQVTPQTGFKISAHTPSQVVTDLAEAMTELVETPGLREELGANGQARVREKFSWESKGRQTNGLYQAAYQANHYSCRSLELNSINAESESFRVE